MWPMLRFVRYQLSCDCYDQHDQLYVNVAHDEISSLNFRICCDRWTRMDVYLHDFNVWCFLIRI